ncbi:hypothetical protein [Sporichthya polymorpha]|uniref:hypothetical protein n=1 Tax=Sporichthya polymorpha TaxID=35751 RepID=UPI0003800F20|nr:hypothetical protein [Sporichthya polymorpha]
MRTTTNRATLAATVLLTVGLIAPASPATAVAGTPAADQQTTVSYAQSANSEQAVTDRRRRWRGFTIAGTLEDKSLRPRRIEIDQRRGPDRRVTVRSWTKIYRNGDRVGLRALREGDRVYVKGMRKNGVRYALKIWAQS